MQISLLTYADIYLQLYCPTNSDDSGNHNVSSSKLEVNWFSDMLGTDTFKTKERNKKNKLLEGQQMQIQDLLILFQAFASDLMNNHRQATSCCFSIH